MWHPYRGGGWKALQLVSSARATTTTTTTTTTTNTRAMAQALCESILKRVQQFDAGAEIASVRRTEDDGSVRVRVTTKTVAQDMLQALRDAWPLANVSQVENLVSGRTETQVMLPDEAEQHELAKRIASRSNWQGQLRKATSVLVALLAVACVQKVVEISRQ